MYIPAGRSEPRTEDLQLLKWIRLCTGSDVMDEKVYWKELGCKKTYFYVKTLFLLYVSAWLLFCLWIDVFSQKCGEFFFYEGLGYVKWWAAWR